MHNDALLSTAQVAERLGKDVATINRYVRLGRLIPSMQFPGAKGARMFHPSELERFVATTTKAATS